MWEIGQKYFSIIPSVTLGMMLEVALGPHEFSAKFRVAEKKLGQNSAVQIDRRNFCMSREFAGGATLTNQQRLETVRI